MRRLSVAAAAVTVGVLSCAGVVGAVAQPHMASALHALAELREGSR
jgi:hypothetical protein